MPRRRSSQRIDDSDDSDEDMPLSQMSLMNLPAELTYMLFTFNGTMLNAIMSVSRDIRNQIFGWDHPTTGNHWRPLNFVGARERREFVRPSFPNLDVRTYSPTYLQNLVPLSESRTEQLRQSEVYGDFVAPQTLKRYRRGE